MKIDEDKVAVSSVWDLHHLSDSNSTQVQQFVFRFCTTKELRICDQSVAVDVEARVRTGPDSSVLDLDRS